MRPQIRFFLLTMNFFLFFSHSGGLPAWAKPSGFCLECHSAKWIQAKNAFESAEGRSVYQAKLEPCPGIRSYAEEIYFTEKRIVQLHQILHSIGEEGVNRRSLQQTAAENAYRFAKHKQDEAISVAGLAKDAMVIRSSIQKAYERTVQIRDESSRRWLIGLASLVFILMLYFLWLALRQWRSLGKGLLLTLLGIGTSLNLGACSLPTPEPLKKSPAQEKVEAALSLASRKSSRMEEAFYQSVVLAQMGREWAKLEAAQAEKALALSWDMALAAREKGKELPHSHGLLARWKDETDAQKDEVSWDTVLDLRDELRSLDWRTWALRAVAEEWSQVDGRKGRAALEKTTQEALALQDPEYRDLELWAIAQSWIPVDPSRSLEICRAMANPYLKATGLTNTALAGQGKGLFRGEVAHGLLSEAWKQAEAASSPYARIKAQIKISTAGAKIFPEEKGSWADRAFEEVKKIKSPELKAMAKQELASKWAPLDPEMAESWAAGIPLAHPAIRAYAFLQISRVNGLPQSKAEALLKSVMSEARKVEGDGFEGQKLKTLALMDLSRKNPEEVSRLLLEVKDPYFRSQILRRMAELSAPADMMAALKWAERIPLEPMRYGATVKLIGHRIMEEKEKAVLLYQEAFQAASHIQEPYARSLFLIDLAKAWGQAEPGKGSAALDWAVKSAEAISPAGLKAEVEEMIAETFKDSDKKKGTLGKAGIDPSVIAARKALEEVRMFSKAEPHRAYRIAQSIPGSFPAQKAMALKEAAAGMKGIQPEAAYAALEAALDLSLNLPETPKNRKVVSQIVMDAAGTGLEKTLHRLRKIQEWPRRDPLLKEAGLVWARKNPGLAMKAALDITEGSSRLLLYQKIAEEAQKQGISLPHQAIPSFLAQIGEGRSRGQKDESQAFAFFEKALGGIENLPDPREKASLLSFLASQWAPLDEKKALAIAEKIPAGFPEPHSLGLMKVGAQLGKWNRKEAESVLEKALATANSIPDPSLKALRLSQLAKEYYALNAKKGRAILKEAFDTALKDPSPTKGFDPVVYEILTRQMAWEGKTEAVGGKWALMKARALLEGAKDQFERFKEENLKPLEKAWHAAQKNKNTQLLGEVLKAWMLALPDKGLEHLAQVDSREIRVAVLQEAGRKQIAKNKVEAGRFLKLALEEAQRIETLSGRIQALTSLARDLAEINKEKAKATYLEAFRAAEREFHSSPKF